MLGVSVLRFAPDSRQISGIVRIVDSDRCPCGTQDSSTPFTGARAPFARSLVCPPFSRASARQAIVNYQTIDHELHWNRDLDDRAG